MTDSRLARTPRSDQELIRELDRRIRALERSKTTRIGGWVLSEQDGRPVLTKPGVAALEAGQQPSPDVIDLTPDTSAFTVPPVTWDLLNIASDDDGALAVEDGTVLLTAPSVGSANVRAAYKTLDADSNYIVEAHIDAAAFNSGTVRAGLMLRQSSTGELIIFGPLLSSGAQLAATKYDSPTAFNAHYANTAATNLLYGMPNWLRIRDDDTYRYFEYSYNRVVWTQFHTPVARDDFLTADQVGVAVLNTSSGHVVYLLLSSFAETSPT